MSSTFFTDRLFRSRQEFMEWVQNVARSLGYVIVIKRSKPKNGYVAKVILMCDRGGICKSKETSTKHSESKKIDCPFEIVAKYSKTYDHWTLTVTNNAHNHPPATYMEGHPHAMRLTESENRLVVDLTNKHVKPLGILSTLKDQNENNVSSLKTVYNAIQKNRKIEQAGRTPMQVLFSILKENNYDFEYRKNDVNNELEELFFLHPISFDIWNTFPYLLLMDATYKTNKYNLPFLQIIGVTSTGLSFCVAFVFMHAEKEYNYTWALNCLKSTMDKYYCPHVIVTDRELALVNACQNVFPEAKHLLCRWHIGECVKLKCRMLFKLEEDWDSFMKIWKAFYKSVTVREYVQNFANLESELTYYPDVLNYLNNTWLIKYKEKFVSLWTDKDFHFKNHTTNRVESQHARLKLCLGSAQSSLDRFVVYIDRLVKLQYTTVKESLERSKTIIYHDHNIQIFQQLLGLVSKRALDLIFKELKRANSIKFDSEYCGCRLRTSCGLPCACELAINLNSSLYIQLESIDMFWKKLDLSSFLSAKEDISNNETQPKVGKSSFYKKLKGILGETLVREPAVQNNTRGRPTLKSKQANKRPVAPPPEDLRRRSCSNTSNFGRQDFPDLNQEPPRHSSYVNSQASYSYHFLNQISVIFHPYITHVQDVLGDGNCGFRAVASALGYYDIDYYYRIRSELLNEFYRNQEEYFRIFEHDNVEVRNSLYLENKGPAPSEHWMVMPETGILIANTYGVIVHFLSNRSGNSTCFPFWVSPHQLQHRVIVLAHVNGNHYLDVRLTEDYPMPSLLALWHRYKHPCAAEWETMYMNRFNLYNDLNRSNYTFDNVIIDD